MRRTVFRGVEEMRQLSFRYPQSLTDDCNASRPSKTVRNRLYIGPVTLDSYSIYGSAAFGHDECLVAGRTQPIRRLQWPRGLQFCDLAGHSVLHIDAEELAVCEAVDVNVAVTAEGDTVEARAFGGLLEIRTFQPDLKLGAAIF
jgi:hypothetical protein